MKFDVTTEEFIVLVTSLIRSRVEVQKLLKIMSSKSAASYDRELEVVEALLEKVQPGSVELIRLAEAG